MPYPLNNVTTQNAYADAVTLIPPYAVPRLNVVVANAAVFMQMERCDNSLRPGFGAFLPEEFWPPGYYNLVREWGIGRVMFRSAVAGISAQVSASVAA